MTAREPGQGRRDLRHHLKPGALGKGYGERKGCGKQAATVVVLAAALPVAAMGFGWKLAEVLAGGA